jgi:CHAT domain-containing protein/tetratricopeptide (TPR) repeat protein
VDLLNALHRDESWEQAGAGRRSRCLAAVFFLLTSTSAKSVPLYGQMAGQTTRPLPAEPQSAEAGPLSLVPGAPAVEITVPQSSKIGFSVQIPQGQAAKLIIEEEQQTSLVTWTDSSGMTHTPRTNRTGLHAEIRFTLLGVGPSAQQFVATTSSRKRAASVLVSVSDLHAATSGDQATIAAEEALAQGDFLWSQHDPKNAREALAAYDRAIADWGQLGDRSMLRRSLEWKATYLAFTSGNAQAAVPLLTQATEISDASDIVGQASTWKTFGFVHTTLAQYPDGWQDYAKALALFQQTGDRFNQEVLLENRGKLSRMTGDYDGALQDANAAATIARELEDQTGVLHIEDDLGEIHLLLGEMQPAFDAYEEVLGLDRINPADPMIGFAETDLADLYHQLDAETQSRDMLARANTFWKLHPYLIGQLATLIQQGKLEADTGNLLKATRTYRHGLELAQASGLKREQVFLLLGLGTVARERRQNFEAASHFEQASRLAVSLDESDALAEIRTAQGDLALKEGNSEAAENYYQRALAVADQSFDSAGTIAALGGLAHAESSLGRGADAREHIERALAGIESTRNFISGGSLRTAYFSSRHSYYALAVQVLMHLNAQHPGGGYDREALNTAERARARFLLDQMEQSGARLERDKDTDAALVASRSNTLRELHLTESSLARLRADGRNTPEGRLLETRIPELLEREDRIEATVHRGEQSSAVRIGVQSPHPSRSSQSLIAQLQSRLDPATVLLEYWTGDDASYLWVVTPTSVHSYTLPRSEAMNALVGRLTAESLTPFGAAPGSAEQFAAVLADSQAHFAKTSLRLGTILLPPRAVLHGVHTLLVVADGPLLSLPLEALRIPQSYGGQTNSVYLQDNYCVVREPSIGVLLELLQRPSRRQSMKIALIADPVFSPSDPRFVNRAAGVVSNAIRIVSNASGDVPDSPSRAIKPASLSTPTTESRADWTSTIGAAGLHRLPFAAREARDIASLAGPHRSYLAAGFSANTERVRSMPWGDYTIAHFATHALLNPARPELASVVLSTVDPSGHPQPGVLWFSDICDLHMPVEVVVLSACQTANGKAMPGEGLVGISYAFFVAGARRVVGSLWDVDDQATETLMHVFYAALLDGSVSPAEALRSAQRKMSKNPRWSDSYYWAGFTIEGDWHPLPQ